MATYRFDVYGTTLNPHTAEKDPLPLVTEVAQRADRYGVDGLLAFYNHRNVDPWAVASAILGNTKNVTALVALQPLAVPPFTAAKLVHSLTRLYRRRIDLNLITGAAKEELVQLDDRLDHDERYERSVEYATIVRALLASDEPLIHEGRYYRYLGLRTYSALSPEEMPRIFVAGSSEASRRAAARVADVAVTHPEPVSMFAETFRDRTESEAGPGPRTAIRVGLIARPTREEAWSTARSQYPADRFAQLKTEMRKKSENDWSRRLATLSTEDGTYDDVYWTGVFRADRGSLPMLVGDYGQVADYLGRYLALGVSVVLLGGLLTEEDFRHAGVVLSALRA